LRRGEPEGELFGIAWAQPAQGKFEDLGVTINFIKNDSDISQYYIFTYFLINGKNGVYFDF
jgi:hypothetical protein